MWRGGVEDYASGMRDEGSEREEGVCIHPAPLSRVYDAHPTYSPTDPPPSPCGCLGSRGS